jgi:hypothetical protein
MNTFASMLVSGTLFGPLIGCSAAGRSLVGRTGAVSAQPVDFQVKAGGHCESSALANALNALGWRVSESDIVGGGGAPSFMFSADGFPFLGGRSARMRETFLAAAGIPYRVVVPLGEGSEDIWGQVFALLDAGRPVPLRVDMRFLPYRYGGKFGPKYMSFGWHWITLFGIDFDRRVAFVSDTEFGELQKIRFGDLDRARRSPLKQWPPRAEFLDLSPPLALGTAPYRRALLSAGIAAVLDNYVGNDRWEGEAAAGGQVSTLPIPAGLAGIEAFPRVLRGFDRYAKPWIAGPALAFLAGCIERNGTGGSAFRSLFREFIASGCGKFEGESGSNRDAADALPALDDSIASWKALSDELDAAGTEVSAKRDADIRAAAYERCAAAAERVAAAERRLYAALSDLRPQRP